MFIVATVVVAYLCYVFSPLVLDKTHAYDNDYARPIVSGIVGLIFGGLLSLKLLRLGIFCLGGGIGILFGILILSTPLQEQSFFSKPYGFDVYYGSFAFVFGVIAVCMEKKMIVFATALIGSFVFMLGIDFFVKSGFSSIIEVTLHCLSFPM